jgi:ribonuclease Z
MPAKRGLRILIQPTVTVQDEFAIPVLNTASVLLSTPKTVLSLAKQVKQEIGSDKVQKSLHHQDLPSPDAEIITLGTGSALPSKYRNVSATLLRVPGCGSYLIDCGEDTLGQLSRVYPPEELLEVLRDLKMIWISHMHADHHLGTTSIIKAWQKANYRDACEDYTLWEESSRDLASYLDDGKKLFIAAEPAMTQWIKEYSSVENLGCDKLVLLDSAPGGLKWNGGSVGFNTPHPEL